jgi:hypothetical protein
VSCLCHMRWGVVSARVWALLMLVLLLPPAAFLQSQTLSLPPRPVGAPGGDAFAASVSALTRDQREELVFQQIMSGNVPEFLRTLVSVSTRATIGGVSRTTRWYVTPDYMALGSNDDYFLMPMTPILAQRLADAIGCSLPTKKMVDAIYAGATVKVAPIPIPPSAAMITIPVFKQHNDTLRIQRAPLLNAHPLGEMVAGHKKDVIISNAILTNLKPSVPKPVVIYGWHQLNGVPIQPVYNGHDQTYADYSHGIRMVQRELTVDSMVSTVDAVLRDNSLWQLLSDEGVMQNPRYGTVPTGTPEDGLDSFEPVGFELQQNFPNPFNPSTQIGFRVWGLGASKNGTQYGALGASTAGSGVSGLGSSKTGSGDWGLGARVVRLVVYDILGREVAVLVDEKKEPGNYAVSFNGAGLASGVYYYTMESSRRSLTKHCILLR